MTFFYVLAAVLFALTAPLPKDARRYFVAQFLYNIVIQVSARTLGTKSPYYAILYCLFTFDIFLMMFLILQNKGITPRNFCKAVAGGMFLGSVCLTLMTQPIRWYQFIGIEEGMILTTCGLAMLPRIRHIEHKNIYGTLALFWLVLAAFRLSFVLHIGNPTWVRYNWLVPATLGLIAFTWVGASAWMESRGPRIVGS